MAARLDAVLTRTADNLLGQAVYLRLREHKWAIQVR
jgi:hypothetical protein